MVWVVYGVGGINRSIMRVYLHHQHISSNRSTVLLEHLICRVGNPLAKILAKDRHTWSSKPCSTQLWRGPFGLICRKGLLNSSWQRGHSGGEIVMTVQGNKVCVVGGWVVGVVAGSGAWLGVCGGLCVWVSRCYCVSECEWM